MHNISTALATPKLHIIQSLCNWLTSKSCNDVCRIEYNMSHLLLMQSFNTLQEFKLNAYKYLLTLNSINSTSKHKSKTTC